MSKDNDFVRGIQGGANQDNEDRPRQKADWWDDLEADICEDYEFRFNVVRDKPEYREKWGGASWRQIRSRDTYTILRKLRTEAKNGKASKTRIEELIYSDFAPPVNPIEEYFKGLRDAPGAISRFCDLVELANEAERDLFVSIFRKWLIGTVANVFIADRCANHTCLVLTGAQGKGKSTLLRSLVPEDLRPYYFQGHLNPENKDSLIALAENFFVNLDDSLAGINAKQINELKAVLTLDNVTVRRPYERDAVQMPRLASFAACSNEATFLHDTTGNRRFAPFELKEINLEAVKAFPVAELWGEAYRAFIRREEYWIAGAELDELAAHNQNFEVQSAEYELVTKYFQLPDSDSIVEYMTNTEIVGWLSSRSTLKLSAKKLGEALVKAGFERTKRKRGGAVVQAYAVAIVPDGIASEADDADRGQDAPGEDCPF